MQEDKVVTEEVHCVGNPRQGHHHPHEGVWVGDRGEGGVERVHTGAEPEELPGGADHGGQVIILSAVPPAGGCYKLASVLNSTDKFVMACSAGVELYKSVQHHPLSANMTGD